MSHERHVHAITSACPSASLVDKFHQFGGSRHESCSVVCDAHANTVRILPSWNVNLCRRGGVGQAGLDSRLRLADLARLGEHRAILAAGAGLSAWVIAPRLKSTGEGLVFFGAVWAHTDASAYVEVLRSASADRLAGARLRRRCDLSAVFWRKYLDLRLAIWLCFAGLVGALPLLASL